MEPIGANGDVYVPIRTTCDGPLVGSSKIAKIEGNRLDFAYDSHMRILGNFVQETDEGETSEALKQLQQTIDMNPDEAEDWRDKKQAGPSHLTDF